MAFVLQKAAINPKSKMKAGIRLMFVTEVPGMHVRVRYMKHLTIEPKMTLISSG